MLAVRLPSELEERLALLASKTGRTKTFYVREAVARFIDDLEDYYLAEERMSRYSKDETVPLAEVMKRYGLAD